MTKSDKIINKNPKKIVVVGAGYSGVLTAKKLEKKLKKIKGQSFEIKLIDKNPYHTMLTELHEVAANRVPEHSIKMDLKKIFANRKVDVVLDEVKKIDYDNKKIIGGNQEYEYDYLVIGTGSKPNYFGIEGVEENAFSLWSYDDAVKLKQHILSCFRKAYGTTDEKEKKKLLSFVVVGAGFTGIELVGEMAEWFPQLCNEFNINKNLISLSVVDFLDKILPSFPTKLADKSTRRLKKMGVTIRTSTKVVKVLEDSVTIDNNGNVYSIESESVIWTAGVKGSEVVESIENKEALVRTRIKTNKYLQQEGLDNVYVVGDNIYYVPKGEKEAVPQMVENAEHSADAVSKNIINSIKGENLEEYEPKFHGAMLCIGGRYGVAYVGTPKKKYVLPSFIAMFAKHFVNILYFINVLGFNKTYSYLKAEILQVRNNRSFVGGHFSNYSPNFWTVPLRIFVGVSWILEGIPKMEKVLDNFNNIFLFNIPSLDGVSSATEAVETYGEALPVPTFITNSVDWVMANVIVHVAPQFQFMMVLMELVLGAMLIFGFLTPVAAIMSCVVCVMVYTSGMAASSILWFFFACIALIGIGGKGQVFSIDYYLMPWMKNKIKKNGFIKKWYLYND